MGRRWADATAFRPDPDAPADSRPSWRQSIALLAALVVVGGVVAVVSWAVRPDRARSFDLLHGSVLIGDQFGPVNVDLGSGRGTLQLRGADSQAGVTTPGDLSLVPFDAGTVLLNRRTGEFNMVDTTGFVAKRDGGVTIAGPTGRTAATGIAAGQLAFIERTGATGTDVLLVGPSTVAVAAASGQSAKSVTPRASYATASQAVTTEGGAAGANGDLWALFGSGSRVQLRHLSLPPDSSTGARLRVSSAGTYDPLSAVESATASEDGSGGDVVGIASPGRIRIFGGGNRTLTYRAPAGLDRIVPTTSAQGRLSWLLHGGEGWSVVSVRTDGSDRRGPTTLRTVAPSATLAPAAQSLGNLYTMLRTGSSGSVYRIGFDGKVSAVAATYPQKTDAAGQPIESASFADGYLTARDSRVVVDSPSHYLALTVFTDGSHKPYVIQKTNLTSVNAAGGADALTKGPVSQKPAPTSTAPPTRQQAQAPSINNKIDCKQVNQKPHVPQIVAADPSSRAIGLRWTYPVLDSQDCLPSTYVVNVKLISADAPAAPGSVTLQGRLDTILSGLYPDTQYELTVTAYINGQATRSLPARVSTGKEGPAAARNITVSADSSGNWKLDWRGCGSIANKCVPVDSWTVQPAFCDDEGLSGSPSAATAPADPTSVDQPGYTYPGGGSLLGRSLQFRITGTGQDGTRGDVSATTSCVQSWAPPVPGDIRLTASAPPKTSSTADSSQTTAAVSFARGAQRDLGGVGGTLTYQLLQDGRVVDSVGPTKAVTAKLDGIKPGRSYQVRAIATPPGHPSNAATVGPVDVTQAQSAWPAIGASVDGVQNNGATGASFQLHVTGVSSAAANGERFNVTYRLRCGDASPDSATAQRVDPADPITVMVDRLRYNGSCTVDLQRVTESDGGVFGGTPAPNPGSSNAFTVDQPSLTGVGSNDFSALWDGSSADGRSRVAVGYSGGDPVINSGLGSWSVRVSSPDGADCGGYSGRNSLDDVLVDQACVDAGINGRSGDGWKVTFTYSYALGTQTATKTDIAGGAAPTYSPPQCDVSSVGARWSGSAAAPGVTVDGNADAIKNCSDFTYTVVGPQTSSCGTGSGPPAHTIDIDTAACPDTPVTPGWSVRMTYSDPGGNARTATLQVEGDPPS